MSDEKTMTETESHGRKVVRAVETFFSEGIARLTQAKKILDQIGAEYQPEGDPMENALAHMSDLINDFLERVQKLPGVVFEKEETDREEQVVVRRRKHNPDDILLPVSPRDKRYARELLTLLDGMRQLELYKSPEARREVQQRSLEQREWWDYVGDHLFRIMTGLMAICEERETEAVN